MSAPLVLSLFPGIGLLDRAFEAEGFCVVRGPDLLWGGDVHTFNPPADRFDGIIGGPPCQFASAALKLNRNGTRAVDLIPEFVRVVRAARPAFVVMENVLGARKSAALPREWHPAKLRDWDCGGLTYRKRMFWTWPFLVMEPGRRAGTPSYSVLASTARRGPSSAMPHTLDASVPLERLIELQGCAPEEFSELIHRRAGKQFIGHVLGNGVPRALGAHVARAAREFCA